MPRKMLLAICFLFALLTPSRDAHAFWRWIRELSGPGPWFGVDLIFPWSLSQPKLTPEMVNRNRDLLDSLELRLPSIAVTLEELAENQEHIALLNDTFGLSLRKPIASTTFLRTPQGFPDAFVDETTRSPARDLSLLVAELDPEALKYFDASHRDPDLRFRYLNEALMRVQSRRLRSILRRFGAGPAGLFGRKAALP
ncbi:MAG: hypothetical protein ACRD21_16910, partial [Vicinamibacteria bacterium]